MLGSHAADPDEQVCTGGHGLPCDLEHALALVHRLRHPFSGGSVDHHTVRALADEPFQHVPQPSRIQRAVALEGRRGSREIAAPAAMVIQHVLTPRRLRVRAHAGTSSLAAWETIISSSSIVRVIS